MCVDVKPQSKKKDCKYCWKSPEYGAASLGLDPGTDPGEDCTTAFTNLDYNGLTHFTWTWIIIWCKKPCAAIFMVETNWYRNMIRTCWYFVVGRNQPICQPTRQQTRSVTMTDPDTNINNSGSFFSMISVFSLCQVNCVRKPANNKLSNFIWNIWHQGMSQSHDFANSDCTQAELTSSNEDIISTRQIICNLSV